MASRRRHLGRWVAAVLIGGLAAGGVAIYELTNSAAVRQEVIAQLRKHFVGAEISLGSARLRLLGGVTITNLTLYRRDDPTQTPFLHVPWGVVSFDKERLAEGQFAIRQLKMERPRLTVVRGADGRWNVDGVLGPVRPDMPVPAVVVEGGTVVLEMAAPGPLAAAGPAPPATYSTYRLEVRHVNLTMLNDPLPILHFRGRGDTPAFGPAQLEGVWDRSKQRLNTALALAPIPLGPAVVRELARVAPEAAEAVQELAGVGRLNLDLSFRPDRAPRWRYQVRAELRDGRLTHRDLPLPLDRVALTARCIDGYVTVESLTATAGAAAVSLKGQLELPTGAEPPPPAPARDLAGMALRAGVRNAEFTVNGLPVTAELFAKLPASLQKYQSRYSPAGPMDLTYRFERPAGGWVSRLHLRPAGLTGRFDGFPYPLSGVRGTLDYVARSGHAPRLEMDLTGAGPGGRPVTIRGTVEGEGPNVGYTLDLTGDGVVLDDTLLAALPAKFQPVARSFHARGRCDVTGRIRQPAGGAVEHDYLVQLRDAAVRPDVFPFPLDDLAGLLTIHLGPATAADPKAGNHYHFAARGQHAGGVVTIRGAGRPTPLGEKIALRFWGEKVPLDSDMAAAFARIKMAPVWDMLRPSGQIDFTAKVEYTDHPGGPPDLDLEVEPRGATVQPSFFPYTLTGLKGKFHYTPGRIEFGGFEARHGATRLSLDLGEVRLLSAGGFWADMHGVAAHPLPVDADLIRALPPALQAVERALQPRGTLAVDVKRLVLSHPPVLPTPEPQVLYWDGSVRFADATLRTGVEWTGVTGVLASRGRYTGQRLEGVEGHFALESAAIFRQPVRGVHVRLAVDPQAPDVLKLLDLRGQVFGGQIGGEGRVEFGSGVRYEMDLKATRVKLEEVAKHNRFGEAQLNGLAKAELFLKGTGAGVAEMEGGGNLHVPEGRMYNLPLVLQLLKVPSLRVPSDTAFEEAHAEFRIHGNQVKVSRLDLLGTAVSLGGQGTMNLDGSDLALDFYAVWAHLAQVLPPGLREVPPWLSKNLFKIRATGPLSDPKFTPEPVPVLVDPVRQLAERVKARAGGREAAAGGPAAGTRLPGAGARGQKPERP